MKGEKMTASATETLELFPDIEMTIEELNQSLSFDTKKENWEYLLADLVDLFNIHFKSKGLNDDEAFKYTIESTSIVCDLIGGQPNYFPRGEKLVNAFRDKAIFRDMNNDVKVNDLSKRYNVSSRQIYNIYKKEAELQALKDKHNNPQLFPDQ